MIRILLTLILLLPCVVDSKTFKVKWENPGAGGMITDVDPVLLESSQSPMLKNVDVATTGFLRHRNGLYYMQRFDPFQLYGAYGYYNNLNGTNNIIGVRDSIYVWFESDTSVSGTDTTFFRSVGSLVGQMFVTDTLDGDSAWHGVGGYAFPAFDEIHDWEQYKDLIIHCDGKSLPQIFTTSEASKLSNSVPDTIGYNPRLISLGPVAPGQLITGVAKAGGPFSGRYQYAYAYLDTVGTDSVSDLSLWSGWVYLNNEYPYIAQFEDTWDANVKAKVLVRRKDDGLSIPYVIDTIWEVASDSSGVVAVLSPRHTPYNPGLYHDSLQVIVTSQQASPVADTTQTYRGSLGWAALDSLAANINSGSAMGDSVVAKKVGYTIEVRSDRPCSTFTITDNSRTPSGDSSDGYIIPIITNTYQQSTNKGQLVYIDTLTDDSVVANSPQWGTWPIDTLMHRPGQLMFKSWSTDSVFGVSGNDTTYAAYKDSIYSMAYGYYDPVTGIETPRGPTFRWKLDSAVNGDTSKVAKLTIPEAGIGRLKWVRLWQGIVKSGFYGGGDTTIWYALYDIRSKSDSQTIHWGNWNDADVVTGLDTNKITLSTVYDYQVVRNFYGEPIVRPPYVWDLQIPFSDIAIFGNRGWGIGDPDCPACIYWSKIDTIFSWNPFDYNFIDDAGDKIIALEVCNNALHAFKRNSIYRLVGDPEYSWTFERVMNGVGAASRKAVKAYKNDVFFMGVDRKFYSLNNGEISKGINTYIDTSLFRKADIKTRGLITVFNDKVEFFNDSTGRCLSYDPDKGTWMVESFGTYIPRGSFVFDTISTDGAGESFDVVFSDSVRCLRSVLDPSRFSSYQTFLPFDTVNFTSGVEWWSPLIKGNGDLITIQSVKFIYDGVAGATNRKLYITIYDAGFDSLSTDSIALSTMDGGQGDIKVISITPSDPKEGIFVKIWNSDHVPSGAIYDPLIKSIEATFREHGDIEHE